MGLDTSFDCWHGPYSSFMYWRTLVAKCVGIDLDRMEGFGGHTKWSTLKPSKLHLLLDHSDCDGSLRWQDCAEIADELEKTLKDMPSEHKLSTGDDLWQTRTRQFVAGLRAAAKAKKNVLFG